jgi:nucleoside-triphosphatase THEP1
VIVILTGDVGSGKTTCVAGLLKILASRLTEADGFLGPRVYEKDRLLGYDLVAVRDGRRFPFLRLANEPGRTAVGPWRLVDHSLDEAGEIILGSRPEAVLVVDELGPLELEGRGHGPSLAAVLDQPGRRFLFVIRTSCLDGFLRRFAGRRVSVHPRGEKRCVETILEELESDGRDG